MDIGIHIDHIMVESVYFNFRYMVNNVRPALKVSLPLKLILLLSQANIVRFLSRCLVHLLLQHTVRRSTVCRNIYQSQKHKRIVLTEFNGINLKHL